MPDFRNNSTKHSRSKSKTFKPSCQDYALFLLSLRGQSVGQLLEKLQRKGYEQTEIDAAISRLTELGYLNDEQFAQIFFDNLKKYKSFGYFGIKKKLVEKKIDKKTVEKLLKSLSLAEERELALKLLEKYKSKTPEQKIRALQSKGYRADVIFKLIGKSYEE